MNKYVVEFAGVLILVFTSLLTDRNPAAMGLVTFAVFTIAQKYNAYFSTLSSTAAYLIGRESSKDALYMAAANWSAVLLVAVAFLPTKAFIDRI
jgi:uncharacterized membrane protein